MTGKKIFLKGINAGKFLSICLMISCLLFLTCANYFLYPSENNTSIITSIFGTDTDDDSDSNYPSSGPTEEKSSNGAFSILEEFLHENHEPLHFASMNKLFQHKVAEAEKIEMVHTELISPPPKF